MSSTKPPRKSATKKSATAAIAATDTIQAPTPTLEEVQAENARLRENNERLEESKARLERAVKEHEQEAQQQAQVYAVHEHAFQLVKQLAVLSRRFESLKVEVRPDLLLDRSLAFESTLVTTYPSGKVVAQAQASDPGRALLEALARFTDETSRGSRANATDLSSLFALIDNRWVAARPPAYVMNAYVRASDSPDDRFCKKA